jgi:multimeric flavodoxin WrbA
MNKYAVILNFSPRNTGNCDAICKHIAKNCSQTDVRIHQITSKVFEPCHSCNYQCLQNDQICPNLNAEQRGIMEEICNSEIIYFVIPNFCGYPNANYFSFNERSVGYFNGNRQLMNTYMNVPKRFIIVSNSESQIIVDAMKQQVNTEPQILYMKTSKYKKRSVTGDMLESSEAIADLNEFLNN